MSHSICPICGAAGSPFGHKGGFSLSRCRRCGHLYAEEVPSPEELNSRYARYSYDRNGLETVPGFVFSRLTSLLRPLKREGAPSRLLDVGFGAGALLQAARELGFEVFGLEVSSLAVEQAQANGFLAVHGDLLQPPWPSGSFDVLCMIELLEHLPDPVAYLASARKLLAAGGVLLLTTPNGASLSARWLGVNWSVVGPPEHLHLFSPTSLRHALQRTGFVSRRIRTEGVNPFELLDSLHIGRWPNSDIARSGMRVWTAQGLNSRLESNSVGRVLRATANMVLSASSLGDSLKAQAVARTPAVAVSLRQTAGAGQDFRIVTSRRRQVSHVAHLLLARTGALNVAAAGARGCAILAYHGVTGREDDPIANRRRQHVPAAVFSRHLEMLRSRCNPLALPSVWESLRAGERLPSHSVVVTIDDGYRNCLTQALPLLKQHGIPATVFVVTGQGGSRLWRDRLETAIADTPRRAIQWDGRTLSLTGLMDRVAAMEWLVARLASLGGARDEALECLLDQLESPDPAPDDDRDRMSWDEIRALAAAGVSIGSHGHIHEALTLRPTAVVRGELEASRRLLERELGPGPYPLAYPFGAWTHSVADLAREVGFVGAVTTDPRLIRSVEDVFASGRMLIGADDDEVRLRTALTGLRAWWSPRRNWSSDGSKVGT